MVGMEHSPKLYVNGLAGIGLSCSILILSVFDLLMHLSFSTSGSRSSIDDRTLRTPPLLTVMRCLSSCQLLAVTTADHV